MGCRFFTLFERQLDFNTEDEAKCLAEMEHRNVFYMFDLSAVVSHVALLTTRGAKYSQDRNFMILK